MPLAAGRVSLSGGVTYNHQRCREIHLEYDTPQEDARTGARVMGYDPYVHTYTVELE
jgi:hypothetical protein